MAEREACAAWRDRLVDFADGAARDEVTAHAAGCAGCAATLARLERSLAAAQAIWDARAADHAAARHPSRRALRWTAAIAAAVILIAILRHPGVPSQPGSTLVRGETTLLTVARRQATAAQLLATADMLREVAGGSQFACDRYTYLSKKYANTAAGRTAGERLAALCADRNGG